MPILVEQESDPNVDTNRDVNVMCMEDFYEVSHAWLKLIWNRRLLVSKRALMSKDDASTVECKFCKQLAIVINLSDK